MVQKHVSDLKKIVFQDMKELKLLQRGNRNIFLDPTKTYVFVGSQTLSVEAGQILTVEFS